MVCMGEEKSTALRTASKQRAKLSLAVINAMDTVHTLARNLFDLINGPCPT